MKFTYIIMLLVAFSIFSFNSATAEEFGYGRTEELPINYSLIPTVNNSDYLRGLTPQQVADLFTEIDSLSLHLSQDNWFNDSNNWNYWDGDSLEFNESKLATIYYNATQSQAVSGTIDGGTLSDTHHPDGNYDGVTFNFSEQAMAPALDLRMNFTNIESFNSGVMRYKTSSLSGDFPVIQLWDYDSSTWEDYPAVAESENFATIEQPVFDDTDHIGTGANLGVVQMRLYKSSNGNTNNHYYIDWVAISKGYGTPSGEEVDPLFEAWLNNPVFDDNVNGSLVNSTWDLIEGSEINASSKLLTSEIESRTNPLVFDLGEDPIIHSDITVSFSKNPSMATAILSTNALAGFEFDSNANFNNPIYASSTITSQNDIRIDSDTYGLELGEDGEVIFKFDGTDTYFQNQVGTGGFRFGGRIEVSEASTGLPTNQQAIQTDGEVSSDQDYRSMQIGTDITSNITGDHTVQAGWFNVRADPDSDGVTEISAIEIVKAFISGKWTTNADVDKWVSYGTYNNLGSAFAGDINNMIGFEFNSINTADITGDINGYGVYVGNISATNPYAIYTNDGVVRFGDRIDATGDANAVFRGEVDQYGRGVIRTTKDMLYTAESGLIDFKADYGDVRVRPGYYLAGEQKFYVANPSTGDAVFSVDTGGNAEITGTLTLKQTGDTDGLIIYGFDDMSAETLNFYVNDVGAATLNGSEYFSLRINNSLKQLIASTGITNYVDLIPRYDTVKYKYGENGGDGYFNFDSTDLVWTASNAHKFKLSGYTELNLDSADLSTTGNINTAEIYNSLGDLKIMPDIQGDVLLFGDTDVADGSTDGNSLYIYRKAAEGDDSFRMYINQYRAAVFDSTADTVFKASYGKKLEFINEGSGAMTFKRTGGGDVHFFNLSGNGANALIKQYGWITGAGTRKYISWQVDDTTDKFILDREDTNILGFNINMPTDIGDATNYTEIKADGEINLHGTARVNKEFSLLLTDFNPGASGPTKALHDIFPTYEFTIDDDMHTSFEMPDDWATGTDITVEIYWAIDEAYADNSGEVRWSADWRAVAVGELISGGSSGTLDFGDVNIPATANTIVKTESTISGASLAADDLVAFNGARVDLVDGNNPTAEPYIIAVRLEYIADKLGEAL